MNNLNELLANAERAKQQGLWDELDDYMNACKAASASIVQYGAKALLQASELKLQYQERRLMHITVDFVERERERARKSGTLFLALSLFLNKIDDMLLSSLYVQFVEINSVH